MSRAAYTRSVLCGAGILVAGPAVAAQTMELATFQKSLDMVWVLFAAGLVLLMQVGFMLLEAGLVRSKNSINVAQKNLLDLAVSVSDLCGLWLFAGIRRGRKLVCGI